MSKVVVTGGAGYVGAALVEKLSLNPEVSEIQVYDNLSLGNYDFFFHANVSKEKIKFEQGDILETRKLQKLVKNADVVVHLASFETSSTDNHSLHQLEQINHWGTAELSYAIENSSAKRFIFSSSAEVYGYSEDLKTEISETAAEHPYGLSKLRAEAHVLRLKEKLDTFVFRPGVLAGYGPVKSKKGVASSLFFDAITKKRVSIHGNGKQRRPLASLDYFTSKLERAVVGTLPVGIYNICQGNMQVLDILEELKVVLPETEFIFTNHHLQLPSIALSSDHTEFIPNENFQLRNVFEDILKYIRL